MNISHRSYQRVALALAVLGALSVSAPARAEVIHIAWDSQNAFERTVQVAPGEFAEVCGKLAKGQAVGWSFTSPSVLNFNVHNHVNKEMVYHAKSDEVARLAGMLKAPVDQNYCWMWSNKNGDAASLSFRLKKQS